MTSTNGCLLGHKYLANEIVQLAQTTINMLYVLQIFIWEGKIYMAIQRRAWHQFWWMYQLGQYCVFWNYLPVFFWQPVEPKCYWISAETMLDWVIIHVLFKSTSCLSATWSCPSVTRHQPVPLVPRTMHHWRWQWCSHWLHMKVVGESRVTCCRCWWYN